MRRRDFLRATLMSPTPILMQGKCCPGNVAADTKRQGSRKSKKQIYIDYITKLLEENWNPKTDRFEFLDIFKTFVTIVVEMFGYGGRTNVYISEYSSPDDDVNTRGACLRRGNYNTPKNRWQWINRNPHIKFDRRRRLRRKSEGNTEPYYIEKRLDPVKWREVMAKPQPAYE